MQPSTSQTGRRVLMLKREGSQPPPKHSLIFSLAPELIQHIGDELGGNRKNLRLACRQFNRALEPQVLSHVVINFTKASLAQCPEQLRAIAAKTSRFSLFARSITLRSLSIPAEKPHFSMFPPSRSEGHAWEDDTNWTSPEAIQAAQQKFSEFLGPALATLKNVHTALWKVQHTDSVQTISTVLDYLTDLPNLRVFSLELESGCPLFSDLVRLSNLHQITIHTDGNLSENEQTINIIAQVIAASPRLSRLEIDTRLITYGPHPPKIHHLFRSPPSPNQQHLTHLVLCGFRPFVEGDAFRHLHSLKSLTYLNPLTRPNPDLFDLQDERDPHESDVGNEAQSLWLNLKKFKIFVESLHVDTVDDDLLEYLSSYPAPTTSDNFAHPTSQLRHLVFKKISALSPATITSRFWVDTLPKHTSTLETLCIQPMHEGRWCHAKNYREVLKKCIILKELALTVNTALTSGTEATRYEAVDTLIDNALELPCLVHLTINSADDPKNAYAPCGSPSIYHYRIAGETIRHAIATFPCVPATTTLQFITAPGPGISSPGQVYQLRTSRAVDIRDQKCTMDYQPIRDASTPERPYTSTY
ncbi:hypothetical protein BDN72DRAFT_838975 [Pluteus cervinus]|uniref:Uncharacterized protein n=1 Tax=Pluteus cervinus TaxID=181527 RepID=A0ACD3AYK0_9AGAR|nr:hypothetical protein BDN72DRAFT_838975 [Pluteus cervinus]